MRLDDRRLGEPLALDTGIGLAQPQGTLDSPPGRGEGLWALTAPAAASAAGTRPWATGRSRRLVRWGASPYLAVTDAAVLVIATVTAGFRFWPSVAIFMAGMSSIGFLGLYRARLHRSVLDDFPRVAAASFLAACVGVLASSPSSASASTTMPPAALVAVVGTLLITTGRFGAYELIRLGRVSGRLRHATVVLGAGQVGTHLVESMQEHPSYGLDPVGFLDADPRAATDSLPAPLLGSWTDLEVVVRHHRIKRVVVAFTSLRETQLVDVLRACDRLDCEIFYVPRLFELHNMSGEIDDVRGIPMIRLRRPAFTSAAWHLKRLFDFGVASATLLVMLPIMAVCALAVRLEGGPGVIFRQQRIGLEGAEFEMLKFRSLRPDSASESTITWNVADDPRIGPVGKFLRQTSLDELPQLWNVVRGQMSLVGPRPERPHFVSHFSSQVPRYTGRHRVPVGITGWAQINGLRGDTSIDERVRFDNYYIENWSLWLDTKILLRTGSQILGRRGA